MVFSNSFNMVAINVIGANDTQLQMLVNKVRGYNKWSSGREFTVESIREYRCEIIYLEYDFTIQYSSLEYAEEHKIKLVTIQEYISMNKSDLKPGMVVENKQCVRFLVAEMNSKLFLLGYHGFDNLCNYNEDLTNTVSEILSICKIYQPKDGSSFETLLTSRKGDLIWERPEEVILTMQKIADKFGIPVEQLKIKK